MARRFLPLIGLLVAALLTVAVPRLRGDLSTRHLLSPRSATAAPSIAHPTGGLGEDVTAQVERLGNPLLSRYPGNLNIYPRNVWDLQAFGNRIYLGSGDSSRNAGPVDVWAYDINRAEFVKESTLAQEQIDGFRVLGRDLYIPGHDPRGGGVEGNYYKLDAGQWTGHLVQHPVVHMYDMLQFGSELFAGISANGGPTGAGGAASVLVSPDGGATWQAAAVGYHRVYSLLPLGGKLFAAKLFIPDETFQSLPSEDREAWLPLYEYRGGGHFEVRRDITFGSMFPEVPQETAATHTGKIVRQTQYRDSLVYIGGSSFNDHQTIPFGLFVAERIEQPRRIALPPDVLPWDIVVKNDIVYVLLAGKQTDGSYLVSVLSSAGLSSWAELFHFRSATFARSFELVDGDFYFGLGTGIGANQRDPSTWEMSPAAGEILRVRQDAYLRLSPHLYLPYLLH